MCMHTHIALRMDTSVHLYICICTHTHMHVSTHLFEGTHMNTPLLMHIICARAPVYSLTDNYVYTHKPLTVHT